MCNRCRQAWLPTNHRNSKGFTSFGDSFHWERIWAIQNPLAEMRRMASMRGTVNTRFAYRYRQSLAATRQQMARRSR